MSNFEEIYNPENNSENMIEDFDRYTELCNCYNDSSRQRGILSEKFYHDVITDKDTDFIMIEGKKIPIFIDIKHGLAMGYDVEKCKKYTDGLFKSTKILSYPIHELGFLERLRIQELFKNNEGMNVFFGDHFGDEMACLSEISGSAKKLVSEKPLIDIGAREGDEQASLCLYTCGTERLDLNLDSQKYSLLDVKKYFDEKVGPIENLDHTIQMRLSIGGDLSDEQAEKIWQLYEPILGSLGERNHPISMLDSRDDFYYLLRTQNTLISAAYSKSQNNEFDNPVCCVFFVDDVDKLYWLNKDFLLKYNHKTNCPNNKTIVFTPDMASSTEGQSYSMRILGLFTKVCDACGMNITMFYENTNISKGYVPKIVDRGVSRACSKSKFINSKLLDETRYRLVSIY